MDLFRFRFCPSSPAPNYCYYYFEGFPEVLPVELEGIRSTRPDTSLGFALMQGCGSLNSSKLCERPAGRTVRGETVENVEVPVVAS